MTKQTKAKIEKLASEYKARMARIKEIESGVNGTSYNPSDCDLTPGRINYSDIKYSKSEDLAIEWDRLWRHPLPRFKSEETRKLFLELASTITVDSKLNNG